MSDQARDRRGRFASQPAPAPTASDLGPRENAPVSAPRSGTPADWARLVRTRPHTTVGPLVRPMPAMTGHDATRHATETFVTYLASPAAREHATWQQAWNALTGAAPQRPGMLVSSDTTCPECRGRGLSTSSRAISAAVSRGLPMGTCPECRGTRRVPAPRIIAGHAPDPQ